MLYTVEFYEGYAWSHFKKGVTQQELDMWLTCTKVDWVSYHDTIVCVHWKAE